MKKHYRIGLYCGEGKCAYVCVLATSSAQAIARANEEAKEWSEEDGKTWEIEELRVIREKDWKLEVIVA